jgi:hypothetical protein
LDPILPATWAPSSRLAILAAPFGALHDLNDSALTFVYAFIRSLENQIFVTPVTVQISQLNNMVLILVCPVICGRLMLSILVTKYQPVVHILF